MSYKIAFRGHQPYKEKFKDSDCVLSISVGQEMHEGEKFAATIAFVNANFRSCTLAVCDTLQRHTMALESQNNADFFYEQSLKEGDLWLERNKKYYEQLRSLKAVVRWDSWLKDSRYEQEKNKIIVGVENDIEYYKSFENTVERFLARRKELFGQQRARELCFDYLIEECATLRLWAQLNCHFEVYPSRRVLPLEETHKRFVLPFYPDLLYPLALKFKRRKEFS